MSRGCVGARSDPTSCKVLSCSIPRRARRSAISSSRPTGQEVSFFEVTTWSRLAEVCGEYLKKGRGVRVVGRLKQDRWTDQEGKPHSRVHIIAEHVEFKPQFKNKDGDGAKEGEEKGEEKTEENAEEQQEGELKEAASF